MAEPSSETSEESDLHVYALMQISQKLVRISLVGSAIAGTVVLTAFSLLYSNLDVPSVVYKLSELAFYALWILAAFFFVAQGSYAYTHIGKWLLRHSDEGELYKGSQPEHFRHAMIHVVWRIALVAIFTFVIAVALTHYGNVGKPLTCLSVHHTLAINPDYPLTHAVKQLNCPDLTKPPEERGEDAGQ